MRCGCVRTFAAARAVLADAVFQGAAFREAFDVVHRHFRDVVHGLAREERLVRGYEHVWECQQARENVVGDVVIAISLKPMIALSGVFISWLIMAMNMDFALFAASA